VLSCPLPARKLLVRAAAPAKWLLSSAIAVLLMSCSSSPKINNTDTAEITIDTPASNASLPVSILKSKSRWVMAAWSDLPGVANDNLNDAWVAWRQSCARQAVATSSLCQNVKRLDGQPVANQRAWLMQNFQPYRVESLQNIANPATGLLTAYYEPVLEAVRTPQASFTVPLYGPPANLKSRSPWYTREEIGKLPAAQNALKGKEIAYLADPIDAMVLHIQGSGRLWVTHSDGSRKQIRLAFAGTNDQPYQSIGRWLLDQNLTKDATWPGIKAWLVQNPKRTQELLAKNPRYVFFKEEALNGQDALLGPKGAQGVPLTPGRSIAVDPGSIPYGTPVWLASQGPQTQLQRLVIAQDTGSAIQGAVRADFYAGSGDAAGELAGRLKQDMKAWVLLPR
jgi:membrane-bound lytic murein transglycosylase A